MARHGSSRRRHVQVDRRGCDDADTAARRRPPTLRGRHRHRDPRPAADRLEDVLRLLDRRRRRGAEHPRLPGLPRPAGRAAGDQPARRRARARDRARDRGDDPGRDALGPQELLLSRPAQGLPDQPVRPAARVARPADVRDVGRARSRSRITRAHLEEDTARLLHATDAGRRRRSASSTSTAPACR